MALLLPNLSSRRGKRSDSERSTGKSTRRTRKPPSKLSFADQLEAAEGTLTSPVKAKPYSSAEFFADAGVARPGLAFSDRKGKQTQRAAKRSVKSRDSPLSVERITPTWEEEWKPRTLPAENSAKRANADSSMFSTDDDRDESTVNALEREHITFKTQSHLLNIIENLQEENLGLQADLLATRRELRGLHTEKTKNEEKMNALATERIESLKRELSELRILYKQEIAFVLSQLDRERLKNKAYARALQAASVLPLNLPTDTLEEGEGIDEDEERIKDLLERRIEHPTPKPSLAGDDNSDNDSAAIEEGTYHSLETFRDASARGVGSEE